IVTTLAASYRPGTWIRLLSLHGSLREDRQPRPVRLRTKPCDRGRRGVGRSRVSGRPTDDAKWARTGAVTGRELQGHRPRRGIAGLRRHRLGRHADGQILGDDLDRVDITVLALDGHGDLRRLSGSYVEPIGRQGEGEVGLGHQYAEEVGEARAA